MDHSEGGRSTFFVHVELEPTDSEKIPSRYREIFKNFDHNLRSLVSMVGLPFTFASVAVHERHRTRYFLAERIRARRIQSEADEDVEALEVRRDKIASERSKKFFEEFRNSADGKDVIGSDISKFLIELAEVEDVKISASDLLLQGTVLTWSALEILMRDTFVAYLNERPIALKDLIEEPSIKRRYDLSKVSIADLITHGFDLSSKMGTLLLEHSDFSDLTTIKSMYSALFGKTTEFWERLSDDKLWMLYQQRNLIVHRRGIFDANYVHNTGTSVSIGDRLIVSPDELESYLSVVRGVGSDLCKLLIQIQPNSSPGMP